MRFFLLTFSIFFSTVAFAQSEFCNWGFAGPQVYRCNGETYYHGTAACNSGIYRDIFCHERFNQNGRACSDDNSRETIDCYNRLVAPLRPSSPRTEHEWCNWGFAGPQVVTCRGQRFVFGTAACRSGIYKNIFCKEEFSGSGQACADDNSEVTVECYDRFIQARPAIRSNQQNPNPSRAVR